VGLIASLYYLYGFNVEEKGMAEVYFGEDSGFGGQPLTLTQLNKQIKLELEQSFPEDYWVVAEISKINVDSNKGHCYLELIDKGPRGGLHAQARATIWSFKYKNISSYFRTMAGQPLKAGLKILFSCCVKFHELYGLSLDINDIDPNYTLGDLARQRQEVIMRLGSEGLLTLNKELALPLVVQRLAIISSATAAGYQDFVHQLESNSYGYQFSYKLFQATMQGNGAPDSVCNALGLISSQVEQFDVVVVIRGGGSQTDLSCFDDYHIAAAIANVDLPVLTGIGHERDETIADMVANTKLKTPTAVASFLVERLLAFEESVNEVYQQLSTIAAQKIKQRTERLDRQSQQMARLTNALLNRQQQLVSQWSQRLTVNPKLFLSRQKATLEHTSTSLVSNTRKMLNSSDARLDLSVEQLRNKTNKRMAVAVHDLEHLSHCISTSANAEYNASLFSFTTLQHKLEHCTRSLLQQQLHKLEITELKITMADPARQLLRGYSLTYLNGKLVRSVADVKQDDILETHLQGGKVTSRVQETKEDDTEDYI
jgi:exodeoxyribonuclease VII large subunit